MSKELTPEERMNLETEKGCLLAALENSENKEVGDYHFIRLIDALILSDKFWALIDGIDLPYTREELTAFAQARQAKRDRIKEIREILGE